jgi:hypothetical protein
LISKASTSHFRKLIKETINPTDESSDLNASSSPHLSGEVPVDLVTNEMRSTGNTSIAIEGRLATLFYEALGSLRQESAVEHLSSNDLKNAIWYLVCDVWFNRNTIRTKEAIGNRLQEFVEAVAKPLSQYEVLLTIANLHIGVPSIAIDNFSLQQVTAEYWDSIGATQGTRLRTMLTERLDGDCLISIRDSGTSPQRALERATVEAKRGLAIIRTYLSAHNGLSEEHFLFNVGTFYVVRDLAAGEVIRIGSRAPRQPFPLRGLIEDQFIQKAKSQCEIISKSSADLKRYLNLALHWISESMLLESADSKILALCSALESLLCTKSDKRKGGILACRMVISRLVVKEHFPDPGLVLFIYELRSNIVHGSYAEICTDEEYSRLLWIARETLSCVVDYLSIHEVGSKAEYCRYLDHSPEASDLIKWLEGCDTPAARDLALAFKESIVSTPS